MDASTASTDSGKTLVSGGVTYAPGHQEKAGSLSVQTFNGSQSMNKQSAGSAVPPAGTTSGICSTSSSATSVTDADSGPVFPKGLAAATVSSSVNTVIQTPLMNSQSVAAVGPAAGATVTLSKLPMQPAGSGATLNGSNDVRPAVVSGATGPTIGTLVSSSQPSTSASLGAGSPATVRLSAPQPAVTPAAVNAPRAPVTVGPAGTQPPTPQMLPPRLPQASPGQPSIHNIQLPPGEYTLVLIAS